jgi:hypothetical protein
LNSNFGLVPDLLRAQTSNATDRYDCGKVLMDLSEIHPDMIYPYMGSFIELLDSEHDSKVECDCNNGKPNES